MIYNYDRDFLTSYSLLDRSERLGLAESMDLNQDSVTEFFRTMGTDNITIKKSDNSAWVFTNVRLHFDESPHWLTKGHIHTFVSKLSPVRITVETVVTEEGERPLFNAKTQLCPINLVTRKVVAISSVSFPGDVEAEPSIMPAPFSRITDEFSGEELVLEETVRPSDTDFTHHTNNTRYVRFIADTFSREFLDGGNVSDFDIQFLKETRDGDKVSVYRKTAGENETRFMISCDGAPVVKAAMWTK